MKIIGLTGSIGSGKSTVAGLMAELGIPVIDLDKVGHNLLTGDAQIRKALLDRFGNSILDASGQINRSSVAEVVFSDREQLAFLNNLMHPQIQKQTEELIEQFRKSGQQLIVIEAPVLIEAGMASLADYVWVTTAPHQVILKRMADKGYSESEVYARLKNQMEDEIRLRHAHAVINTHTTFAGLRSRIQQLLLHIRAEPIDI